MKLGHCALTASDPKALSDFYKRFLRLHGVGEAVTEQTGAMVFLSTDPHGPPQLQLMSNPQGRHVAFQVDTLTELRELYAMAPSRDAQVVMSFDHGPTLSFYVRDPEGNACEVYCSRLGYACHLLWLDSAAPSGRHLRPCGPECRVVPRQ
jgi:catechol 2,3-dioxygenase